MNRMSEMEEKSREANNGNILFTEAESAEYRSLVDESAGLSARLRNMVSGKEAEMLKEREDLGAKLRETIKKCSQQRENATTVLANKVTGDAGGDNNTYANLEAGGLIPVTIKEIIDTKVAGI
jgi:hypothetical protein